MNLQLIFELSERTAVQAVLAPALSLAGGELASPFLGGAVSEIEPGWAAVRWQLPWAMGLELMARIRQALPKVGIVVTHANRAVADCVQAYDSGADIVMNEPASDQELLAMSQALVRRLRQASVPPAARLQPS